MHHHHVSDSLQAGLHGHAGGLLAPCLPFRRSRQADAHGESLGIMQVFGMPTAPRSIEPCRHGALSPAGCCMCRTGPSAWHSRSSGCEGGGDHGPVRPAVRCTESRRQRRRQERRVTPLRHWRDLTFKWYRSMQNTLCVRLRHMRQLSARR